MKESVFREFKIDFPPKETHSNTIFFLLKEDEKILSMGGLMTIDPVLFNDKKYKILGFVEVISNIKGKGFGKKLIQHMLNYLKQNDAIGMGFTMPKNTGFYESCGLSINRDSTQRFVYLDGEKRVTNQDGQVIFYMDSSDNFMKEVLAHPDKEVILPTAGLW